MSLHGCIHGVSQGEVPVSPRFEATNGSYAPMAPVLASMYQYRVSKHPDYRFKPAIPILIFSRQTCGPILCTDSPFTSTATVTGMSFTSNS